MRHNDILELKEHIRVLNDSVTELQQNLMSVARAAGMEVYWHSAMNGNRFRLFYKVSEGTCTIKKQLDLMTKHLDLELVIEPAKDMAIKIQKVNRNE